MADFSIKVSSDMWNNTNNAKSHAAAIKQGSWLAKCNQVGAETFS
jgi:hypothetical protein